MENDTQPTIEQAENAAKAAARNLSGKLSFWLVRHEIPSTERR